MLSPVSHRDLALTPTGGSASPKTIVRRGTYKFTRTQLRELDKIRKTTWGKERTMALETVARDWNVPKTAVSYRIYKNGAPSKATIQKRNSRPVRKVKPAKPVKAEKRKYTKRTAAPVKETPATLATRTKDTKLRFKITSLEIDNGEIVMTLRT